MRTLAILIMSVVLVVGCKKKPKSTEPDSKPAPYVSTVGGPTGPNQNGNLTVTGGQGAIQGSRMAGARVANKIQLGQLHTSISQTWLLDNRMPTPTEIMKDAQQNSQLYPLLKEEVVVLTGAKRGSDIWAYTQYPQQMGEHFVVTQQGVEQMSPEELRKRLEAQGAPIKLAK